MDARPPAHLPPVPDETYATKASFLRGFASALRASGQFDAIVQDVSPATRALLLEPPVSSTWLDPRTLDEVMAAIEARGGLAAVRRTARAGLDAGVVPLLRPITAGLLRLFGASPATLFRRIDTLIASTLRGVVFAYTERGPRAGTIDALIHDRHVPMTRFYRFVAAYELIGDVSGKPLTATDPVLIATGPWGACARSEVSW